MSKGSVLGKQSCGESFLERLDRDLGVDARGDIGVGVGPGLRMIQRREFCNDKTTGETGRTGIGTVDGRARAGDDQPTSDPANDRCGKRLASCKLRFGAYAELPFGGFPGVGLIR